MATTRKLTTGLMAAYGTGHFGISLLMEAVLILLIHHYAAKDEVTGTALLSIGAATLALGVAQVFDAAVGPFIGHFSDRTRTRYGRRAPWIALAAIPMCITFALLWTPPTPHESVANLVFLTVMCTMFIIAYSAVTVPYLAWLPDIARTVAERASASSWMALFNVLGAAAGGAAGLLAAKAGHSVMGVSLAVLAFIAFSTTLGARLHTMEHATAAGPTLNLRGALATTLGNPHFRVYIASFALYWVGLRILLYMLPWMAGTILGLGKNEAEAAVAPMQGCAIGVAMLSFPLMTWLTKRWGKLALYRFGLLAFGAIAPLFLVVGKAPGISPMAQMLVLMGLAGVPTGIMFVIPYTILADVIDYDENQVGERREAMYFGVQGVPVKAAWLCGLVAGGLLCSVFDAESGNDLGPRLAGPVSAAFVLAAYVVFRRFSLAPRDESAAPESSEAGP